MSNNTYKAFTFGKLDHLKLMYNKTIDELIKDEFEGFSGVFILAKLKNFILKFMPEYMNFLVDRVEKVEPFNPETFGFKLTAGNLQDSFIWKRDNIEIFNYRGGDLPSIYKIHSTPPEKDLYYETQTLYFNTELYLGSIPSYSFAFQLFKNLGIEIK